MIMSLPGDYAERVYAGVLGKIIGVYLGKPFEQWTHERIMAQLGEIYYYVTDPREQPVVAVDDDISGTFTFLRALPDYGNPRDITPEQIGQTWLNYLIEDRTVLWWGGIGNSTEHTAYMRLKAGLPAPHSGSIQTNGQIIAEQIGAQIFIDGWAMVAPGDPEYAVELARRAASVSHDGEAIYGAQVVAAMESLAFVEPDRMKLLEAALSFIPPDSAIYRMIADVREWHSRYPDWRQGRERIAGTYNYENYGGACHMVPNHALIILGLLYGDDDFQKSLMITNTSGWDTDCNSGNLGCLLGIKNGLAAIDAGPDWRGPVADRLYLPTADGGRAITDAVTEAYHVINVGRALAGESALLPKDGARFHFEMPGSVQGFRAEETAQTSGTLRLENVRRDGTRYLALHYQLAPGRAARAVTPTFMPLGEVDTSSYGMSASPTLYAGQTVRGRVVVADGAGGAVCRPFIRLYDAQDELITRYGAALALEPNAAHSFAWTIEDTGGLPIAQLGLEITAGERVAGTVYLDYLTWDGVPAITLERPDGAHGEAWRMAWVNAADNWDVRWPEAYHVSHNHGTGLLIHGAREWAGYRVTSTVSTSFAERIGIAAHVQGLRRYYALVLCADNKARLVKMRDVETVLAEADFVPEWTVENTLALHVQDNRVQGWIDGRLVFDVVDAQQQLTSGAVALIVTNGTLISERVRVTPAAGAGTR
jgi:ADP-ribosylglycohydrolase